MLSSDQMIAQGILQQKWGKRRGGVDAIEIGAAEQQQQWTAERAGMWSPHYVDRLLAQPSNWLQEPASVPQAFTSSISNTIFFFAHKSSREEETDVASFAFYFHLKGCPLLVPLWGRCSGFFEGPAYEIVWIWDRKAVLRLGVTTVLSCSSSSSCSRSFLFSNCIWQLDFFWGVCVCLCVCLTAFKGVRVSPLHLAGDAKQITDVGF